MPKQLTKIPQKEFDQFFDKLWYNSRKEIFKLEVLPDYSEDHNEIYDLFLADKIDKAKEAIKEICIFDNPNIIFNRVHIVDLPLSEYLKFELVFYKVWQELGANIYFTTFEKVRKAIAIPILEDFLLFDDKHLIINKFDKSTKYLYSEYSDQKNTVSDYIKFKIELMKIVEPMDEFIGQFVNAIPQV